MPAKFARVPKYTSPDGQQFDTLGEAQLHELDAVLAVYQGTEKESLCAFLIQHAQDIVPILSQRERKRSSPAKRKLKAKSQTLAPAIWSTQRTGNEGLTAAQTRRLSQWSVSRRESWSNAPGKGFAARVRRLSSNDLECVGEPQSHATTGCLAGQPGLHCGNLANFQR